MHIKGNDNCHINGNDNCHINGNDNHVGDNVHHHHYYTEHNQEEKQALAATTKIFRNKGIDLVGIYLMPFFVMIVSYLHLNIYEILATLSFLVFMWYQFLPNAIKSMYITVHSDRFFIGDKCISYNELRSCEYNNSRFFYKYKEEHKEHKIDFYSTDASEYLLYRIKKYDLFFNK
jgi:hypothetical protein